MKSHLDPPQELLFIIIIRYLSTNGLLSMTGRYLNYIWLSCIQARSLYWL